MADRGGCLPTKRRSIGKDLVPSFARPGGPPGAPPQPCSPFGKAAPTSPVLLHGSTLYSNLGAHAPRGPKHPFRVHGDAAPRKATLTPDDHRGDLATNFILVHFMILGDSFHQGLVDAETGDPLNAVAEIVLVRANEFGVAESSIGGEMASNRPPPTPAVTP